MLKDELDGVLSLTKSEHDLPAKVVTVMSEQNAMTADEIAAAAAVERPAVLKALRHLCDAGALLRANGGYRLLSPDERE